LTREASWTVAHKKWSGPPEMNLKKGKPGLAGMAKTKKRLKREVTVRWGRLTLAMGCWKRKKKKVETRGDYP